MRLYRLLLIFLVIIAFCITSIWFLVSPKISPEDHTETIVEVSPEDIFLLQTCKLGQPESCYIGLMDFENEKFIIRHRFDTDYYSSPLSFFSWSPTSKQFVFHFAGRLYPFEADASVVSEIFDWQGDQTSFIRIYFDNLGRVGDLEWTPDGRYLVFLSELYEVGWNPRIRYSIYDTTTWRRHASFGCGDSRGFGCVASPPLELVDGRKWCYEVVDWNLVSKVCDGDKIPSSSPSENSQITLFEDRLRIVDDISGEFFASIV